MPNLIVLIVGILLGAVLTEAVRRLHTLTPMTGPQLQVAAHGVHKTILRWFHKDVIIVMLVANRSTSVAVHNAESDGHAAKALHLMADGLASNRFAETRIER